MTIANKELTPTPTIKLLDRFDSSVPFNGAVEGVRVVIVELPSLYEKEQKDSKCKEIIAFKNGSETTIVFRYSGFVKNGSRDAFPPI